MKLKELLFTFSLIALLLFVIVDYIYLQHATRNQFVDLQALIEEERNLNTDWGKLQIEHSTLVSNSTIESKAKIQLDMKVPDSEHILNIKR